MKRLLEKIDERIMQRLKIFLPLLGLGIVLALCLSDIEQREYNYLLLSDAATQSICGRPTADMSLDGLQVKVDDHAADAQLLLDAEQEVSIKWNGQTYSAETRHETVDNLLRRLKIKPTEEEMVILDTNGGISIYIDDEVQLERKETVKTAYTTERISNPMLKKGTERVKQEGAEGTVVKTYLETYQLGKVVSSELIGETPDNAVTEIIEYGTLVNSVDRDDYIVSVHPSDDGSGGYLTFASGETMVYDFVTTCNTTAYSGGWATASGYPVGVGNIAVDPTVFPYGTRMFVQTVDGSWVYGMAVARDTGTSIKGYKLDLWFTSYDEACAFGRRDCTVYVLS